MTKSFPINEKYRVEKAEDEEELKTQNEAYENFKERRLR